ncbi:hypothetical protein CTEN210_15333 [Chaetoceros tenuissimus]|uniref:RING-type domain-containing protein n=1 Tax=Chaetoceros tenuissimus TaxID=426638 RepID=A0AAD3D6L9_9STRA|nr:hypothetical protein CTEN210_15333 [Chaetoceros tenuissimus]
MDKECQICMIEEPLLWMPCGHRACRVCLERVLFARVNDESTHENIAANSIIDEEELIENYYVNCSGWGRCPFCRRLISMYDIKESADSLKSFYTKHLDIWSTEVAGLIYVDRDKSMRIEFPSCDDEIPTVTFIAAGADVVVPFEDGFHYNKTCKSFYGCIDLSKVEEFPNKEERWEMVMQFSTDLRFIIHGMIVKKPISLQYKNIKDCPLSGTWIVRWQRSNEKGVDRNDLTSVRMKVYGNKFVCHSIEYELNLGNDEESRVHFHWPYSNNIQVAESGVNLQRKPDGPDIGETIVWTVDSDDYFRIFWTRETKEILNEPCVVQRLGYRSTLFHRIDRSRQREKPECNSQSLFPNVFMQGLTIGIASYHFVSKDGDGEEGAYISYESIKCADWPPLDNGSPVPARVPFEDISYDEETRTFRGTIPWQERYGTSWNGAIKWNYEMKFDSEFICIATGNVKSIRADGNSDDSFNHIYGESLLYVNGGIFNKIRQLLTAPLDDPTAGQPNDDETEIDGLVIRANIEKIRERLSDENVSARLKHYITTNIGIGAFTMKEDDLIDYNL